jgi:hypothetical protein
MIDAVLGGQNFLLQFLVAGCFRFRLNEMRKKMMIN